MQVEAKYQDLLNKKAKAEAQVEMFEAKIVEIEDELREKFDIEPEQLDELIQIKTENYEKRKSKALKEQDRIMKELDDIIQAVKV